MPIDNIFGIASTAMNAQLVRMNTTASNLANAGTVAESEEKAFKAKRPVFQALVMIPFEVETIAKPKSSKTCGKSEALE